MDQVFNTPEDVQGFQDEESREPSVLEYARFYGLTTNYLTKEPFEEAIQAASELDIMSSLKEPANLPKPDTGLESIMNEKLTINSEAAKFLKEILYDVKNAEDLDITPLRASIAQSLIIEPPLLGTDHEHDLLQFGNKICPNLRKCKFVLPEVDIEKVEDLEWPEHILEARANVEQEIGSEKLEIPRESMLLLQSIFQDAAGIQDSVSALLEFFELESVMTFSFVVICC